MSGIRIPLTHFLQNVSGVDLTHLTAVEIRMDGTGIVAIDNIEFGK
jgi:hypothetical protein